MGRRTMQRGDQRLSLPEEQRGALAGWSARGWSLQQLLLFQKGWETLTRPHQNRPCP